MVIKSPMPLNRNSVLQIGLFIFRSTTINTSNFNKDSIMIITTSTRLPSTTHSNLFRHRTRRLNNVTILPLKKTSTMTSIPTMNRRVIIRIVTRINRTRGTFILIRHRVFNNEGGPNKHHTKINRFPGLNRPNIRVIRLIRHQNTIRPKTRNRGFLPVDRSLFTITLIQLPRISLLKQNTTNNHTRI